VDAIIFDPYSSFTGLVTFEYTVADGDGGFDSATVTVTVNPSPAE
jgi:hypothetical protein